MLKFGYTTYAAQIAARPKSSVPFYEKLSIYVSVRVSDQMLGRQVICPNEPANQQTSEPANQQTSKPANQQTSKPQYVLQLQNLTIY